LGFIVLYRLKRFGFVMLQQAKQIVLAV